MKHFVLACLLVLVPIATLAARPDLRAGHYRIDTAHSYAHFQIGHMGLSTIRGRVDVDHGMLTIGRHAGDSHVEVVLDPASVDTGNAARDKKLREMAGFFDVSKYPRIRFVSSQVELDGDKASVKGRLTLHGQTHPATLHVHDIACRKNPLDQEKYTCGFSARTTVQRSRFGMDAFSALVGDRVKLNIEVEADKPLHTAD